MAPNSHKIEPTNRKVMQKGAWTEEEDRRLSHYIETHGAKKWKTIAIKAGLNRCGKSCRLRWLNYLRPNIKRGNISDEEEDLILRLHRLLGNRWSLIAGRLPGRTDNEIKNYWNSYLSKKINYHKEKSSQISAWQEDQATSHKEGDIAHQVELRVEECVQESSNAELNFDADELFDFSMEGSYGLDWVDAFLELDEDPLFSHSGNM